MSPRTLIIADDLTGAQDTAVQLRRPERRVVVALSDGYLRAHWGEADIWAIDTETRFLPADAARAKVRCCLEALSGGDVFVYKKVDSTLRGNVGAEIEAVLTATGKAVALFAPALPHSGRTVVDGVARVRGVPLAETEFGRDPFTPVATSDVTSLVALQTALPVGRISLDAVRAGALGAAVDAAKHAAGGPTILVCDGETDADLALIASLADREDVLFCGSSGLASALFGVAAPARRPAHRDADVPFLMVVGSLSSVSRAQAARFASDADGVTIRVPAVLAASDADEARRRALAAVVAEPHLGDRHILVRCDGEPVALGGSDAQEAGRRIARCLSLIAHDILGRTPRRRLFLTGGEMAAQFLATVDADAVALLAEAEPGVPAGEILGGALAGRLLFSKAGGFGGADLLLKLIEREDA